MPQVTFDITTPNMLRVVAAAKHRKSIPKDENETPLFSDNAWAKETMRRMAIEMVMVYERDVARIAVVADNDLLT